jgi:hypothetical protein
MTTRYIVRHVHVQSGVVPLAHATTTRRLDLRRLNWHDVTVMTVTLELSVSGAAAHLGRSERTVWRQIRAGTIRSRRDGRRVVVLIDADRPLPAPGVHGHAATGEAAAPYGTSVLADPWRVGPWPYTPELIDRHRAARLARRKAAIDAAAALRARVRPDPDGLTYQDYRDADDEFPRALDGGAAADITLEERGRARRADR